MKELTPYELNENFFYSFGKEWALVVVEDDKEDNAMTISWGHIGILWSRPTISVFIRNTRHTKHMMDNCSTFSVSFFDKSYKDKLSYCGMVSRKDEDKISKCNFTRDKIDDTLFIKEAKVTFILKKIYQVDLPITKDTNPSIIRHYQANEYHTQYIGEIIKVLVEE